MTPADPRRYVAHLLMGTEHFFVVGCPRSGTTLLSVLLDRHSRLSVPPETAFFDEVAPLLARCTTPARQMDVLGRWRRLGELDLEPEAVVERLGRRSVAPGEILDAILQMYAEARGKVRGGEKTPRHLMHVPAILEQFPGAKVVCMLRDGRDASLSLNAMPWWAPRDLAAAARVWKQSARLAERFARRHPEQFEIVRYEDLVARPEDVLSSVMTYLGETFESGQIRTEVPSQVVLPRSIDWKGAALGPIEAARVGQRRAAATAAQVALLDRELGTFLNRFGYD
jgi:hypothetical protein